MIVAAFFARCGFGGALVAQAGARDVEETLRWLRLPPPWLSALVILPLVIGFVWFFYRRERPSGGSGWKWLLGAIRVAVLVVALAMLAQPVCHRTSDETRDSTLLVLADDSLSMDFADRFSDREVAAKLAEIFHMTVDSLEQTTRYDLVRRLLDDPQLALVDKLRLKGKVRVATFAQSLREVGTVSRKHDGKNPEGVATAEASAEIPPYALVRGDARVQETRIGDSLRDAVVGARAASEREDRIASVLLLTDGQQNADTIPALDVARKLGERGTPVYCIGVGNPDDPKDLRVVHVDANDVVLVDDRVSFDAILVTEGFEGERVRVELRIDSETVDSRSAVVEGGGKRQSVRLEYRPRRKGEFTATVEVEKLGGEVFYDNNSLSRPLRVIDQKIKVLYVENLPRWEYRYLKNALIRDLTVEAQVYLHSADPGFVQESSPGVPPLERLPTERSELFQYHVVILGDVEPKVLGDEKAKLLSEFVADGGGLIFLAGPHFNPSGYSGGALDAVLPVRVSEADRLGKVLDRGPITSSFNVKLTAVGREHQVLRLDSDPDRNVKLWENDDGQFYDHLPGFFWYAQVEEEKAGATVLARHPADVHPIHHKGRVIFASMNYQKGRSFFSAVDDTWRWRAGIDNFYFYRFWGQVLRFVATGRFLAQTPRFSISTDKNVYAIGETVKIDARVFDANMLPLKEKTVTVYHQAPGRENEPPQALELSLNAIKELGAYDGALSAAPRGRHDVWLGSESERLAFKTFTVEIPALETRDPRLNRGFLKRLAAVSGGQYFDLQDGLRAADRIQASSVYEEGLVESNDVWDEWWVVVVFTVLIAVEWILRKAVRLL